MPLTVYEDDYLSANTGELKALLGFSGVRDESYEMILL